MEKLIELLNEYSELRLERLTEEEWQPIRKRHDYELEYPIEKIRIISKQYWFIQWLVENDKIDIEYLKEDGNLTLLYHYAWKDRVWNTAWEWNIGVKRNYTDVILMLLSIQDNPIEFLISILK